MEFWEDLSKKISDAADYTVRETEKFTSIAKIKYKLGNLNNKRDMIYQNIGKLRYSEYKTGIFDKESYENYFNQIDKINNEIKMLEETLAQLKNFRICQNCGYKVARTMLYCPNCGMKQPADGETNTNTAAKDENSDS